jgi:hypothetical protein
MADKWYNSVLANGAGVAIVIASIGFGLATMIRGCGDMYGSQKIEMEKVKRGYQLQTADLNGNGIPDKFYVIDGKIAVVEMDGKPAPNSLDSKVEK